MIIKKILGLPKEVIVLKKLNVSFMLIFNPKKYKYFLPE